STSKKSTSGKPDLIFHRVVTYTKHNFHLLKPLSQFNNSFCTFEVKRLELHEVWRLSASRDVNAQATPWSISALSWASVTEVVVVVVVAGDDLVVLL
nr:hypothetical protein [Tanacetum cinerariifolium]